MLNYFLEMAFGRVAERLMADAERRLERSRRAFKRTGVGIAVLQLAVPFFFIGFGLGLTALFLVFAHLPVYQWATFWTALVSAGFGLLLSLIGFGVMSGG